jgi:hypothetical protein
MKVVRLSAQRLSVRGWVDPRAAGTIMWIKNCNDIIGNQTRDLQACSVVPQSTAPPHGPYCHQGPVRVYKFFSTLSHKRHDFRKKKKKLLNSKCVLWFSLQLLSETFLILRRNWRDMMKNVYWSSCKVPVILVWFYSNIHFNFSFKHHGRTQRNVRVLELWANPQT